MRRDNVRRLERLERERGTAVDAVTEIYFVPMSKEGEELRAGEPILFWRAPD
jgi:uncharacterized protein (UPF0335 family)